MANEINNYCKGIKHVVKQGDTLYKISRMHNVPLAEILRANANIEIYNLMPGQVVCVPVDYMMMPDNNAPMNPGGMQIYVIKDGESFKDILDKLGLEAKDVLDNNDAANIYMKPGTTIYIPVNRK